jgi:hypothetical protein
LAVHKQFKLTESLAEKLQIAQLNGTNLTKVEQLLESERDKTLEQSKKMENLTAMIESKYTIFYNYTVAPRYNEQPRVS